jgi:hypothetical protein
MTRTTDPRVEWNGTLNAEDDEGRALRSATMGKSGLIGFAQAFRRH